MRIMLICCAMLALAACDQNQSRVALDDAGADKPAEKSVAKPTPAPLEKSKALALMKARHQNFEKIGKAMKIAGRELKAASPNIATVRQSADTIAALARQVPGWFPAGTGPDVGKTEAKAAIWQKPQDFKVKSDNLIRASGAFQMAARSGDLAAIRAAQGSLGKSCKACHDPYRTEH